jgi:hypothetical protein
MAPEAQHLAQLIRDAKAAVDEVEATREAVGQMRHSIGVDAEAQAQREYDEVVAQYKGTDQWLKAPNGKPTNLTEHQWVQVRTPSFKKWFGDWENDPANASKVVDENGEPLVAYHSSPVAEITKFNAADTGIWFADKNNATSEWGEYQYPVFLNIRNMDEINVGGDEWFNGNEFMEGVYNSSSIDGVKFNDFSANGHLFNTYNVKSPNQIKSATDNIGTFDEANPDIRYSIAADTEHRDLYERYKAGDESALEEARQMVREAAAKAMPYTKVVDMDSVSTMP